jgi:glycosyltransferase involved in cell wall biosynthesis
VDQKTDFDFEVIVGEDCSTDGTREIVREFENLYPGIVRPIYHSKNINKGSYNYLTVHQAARGQYVAHIDGDDLMFQGKLQAQSQILDSNSMCTAVWHRVDFFDDDGNYCSGKGADLSPFSNGTVYFEDAIRLGYVSVHSSLMYRRSARNPEPNSSAILDLYSTWDLLSSGPGYILNEVFGAYRVGATGSLLANSQKAISRLGIEHAIFFLRKFPEKRRAFFLFAISNAIVSTKNLRITAFDYFKFALKAFACVSPQEILTNLQDKRRIQVPWKNRKQCLTQEK